MTTVAEANINAVAGAVESSSPVDSQVRVENRSPSSSPTMISDAVSIRMAELHRSRSPSSSPITTNVDAAAGIADIADSSSSVRVSPRSPATASAANIAEVAEGVAGASVRRAMTSTERSSLYRERRKAGIPKQSNLDPAFVATMTELDKAKYKRREQKNLSQQKIYRLKRGGRGGIVE